MCNIGLYLIYMYKLCISYHKAVIECMNMMLQACIIIPYH